MAHRIYNHEIPQLVKTMTKWLPACLPGYRMITHSVNKTWPKVTIYTNCKNLDEITTVLCCCGNYETMDNSETYTFYSINNEHLRELLGEPNVLDWDREANYFQIVSTSQLQIIEDVMQKHNRVRYISEDSYEVELQRGYHIYTLTDRERALTMAGKSLPDGFKFGTLKTEHNSLLQSKWHYPIFAPSLQYYANAIRNLSNLAIYNEKDEIVSWAVVKAFGDIGHTYTMPEYRRRGFASLITANLAKRIVDTDKVPHVVIRSDLKVSIKVCERLGFTKQENTNVSYYYFVSKAKFM